MHISEGVLAPAVLAGGAILAAAGTCIGLRKMDYSHLLTTAILASAFFVGSLVHVPLGPGNVHLVLNGLMGLFLGWGVFPALLVALLLQAILFQFGGLAVLGVNVINMALPALLCHFAFAPLTRNGNNTPVQRNIGAFCTGAFAVGGAACFTALALGLSNEDFWLSAKLLLLAHLPVMVIEGIITALVVSFIYKIRPELLYSLADDAGRTTP